MRPFVIALSGPYLRVYHFMWVILPQKCICWSVKYVILYTCALLHPFLHVYVHSTSLGISHACIHLGVHDHHVSNWYIFRIVGCCSPMYCKGGEKHQRQKLCHCFSNNQTFLSGLTSRDAVKWQESTPSWGILGGCYGKIHYTSISQQY